MIIIINIMVFRFAICYFKLKTKKKIINYHKIKKKKMYSKNKVINNYWYLFCFCKYNYLLK